ncbi:unnamed protein product [Paramecium primaurelia]|uniref:Uncharacterized protein n=1 Tax=Paramecium primaurelia TaxID=5886 RepID=A0A8S1QKM6_PARPR|nr:unnamed protein product [Paramecium primaurelia]
MLKQSTQALLETTITIIVMIVKKQLEIYQFNIIKVQYLQRMDIKHQLIHINFLQQRNKRQIKIINYNNLEMNIHGCQYNYIIFNIQYEQRIIMKSQYFLFFPSIDQIKFVNWTINIYFSGTQFSFSWDYTKNNLRGSINDIQFQLLYKSQIDSFKPSCHYSCLT